MKQLMLFRERRDLLTEGSYSVQGDVAAEFLPEFLRAIQGERVQITASNVCSLSALCDEFGFALLSADCESFLEHNPNLVQNRRHYDAEERITRQEAELATLKSQIASLSTAVSK
jgi:hypothetical protein